MEKIRIWDPGSWVEKSWIQDPEKHPGSARLVSESLYLPAKLTLLHIQAELIPWKFLHSLKV
jgi:hypothetical protein